jgi:hypothetical protein
MAADVFQPSGDGCLCVMSYQYLFCASCGTRRTGHGYQCSVCGNLLRHARPGTTKPTSVMRTSTVQWQAPALERAAKPERQPIAA